MTPWSVEPEMNPAGQQIAVRIRNAHGNVAVRLLGSSRELVDAALTLCALANARPHNVKVFPDAIQDGPR